MSSDVPVELELKKICTTQTDVLHQNITLDAMERVVNAHPQPLHTLPQQPYSHPQPLHALQLAAILHNM